MVEMEVAILWWSGRDDGGYGCGGGVMEEVEIAIGIDK